MYIVVLGIFINLATYYNLVAAKVSTHYFNHNDYSVETSPFSESKIRLSVKFDNTPYNDEVYQTLRTYLDPRFDGASNFNNLRKYRNFISLFEQWGSKSNIDLFDYYLLSLIPKFKDELSNNPKVETNLKQTKFSAEPNFEFEFKLLFEYPHFLNIDKSLRPLYVGPGNFLLSEEPILDHRDDHLRAIISQMGTNPIFTSLLLKLSILRELIHQVDFDSLPFQENLKSNIKLTLENKFKLVLEDLLIALTQYDQAINKYVSTNINLNDNELLITLIQLKKEKLFSQIYDFLQNPQSQIEEDILTQYLNKFRAEFNLEKPKFSFNPIKSLSNAFNWLIKQTWIHKKEQVVNGLKIYDKRPIRCLSLFYK